MSGADQSWYDGYCNAEAMGEDLDNTTFRYERRNPPIPPVRLPDLTSGGALVAFIDALLARAEFSPIVWVQGRPQEIRKATT